MRHLNTDELVQASNARLLQSKATEFSGLGTDTRKDLQGQLFWALVGEQFDAHDYLDKAVAQGAAGIVTHREPTAEQLQKWNVSVFLVKDTLTALQDLARFLRRRAQAKIVGITGSNGKTSTKEFLARILQSERRVHWNPGSFNNHFGLPFNLIQAPPQAQVVIAEMGMNHAGELTTLCQIAEPDVVVCTMVGSAHMEHFGTTEKIAAAKEEIYLASPAGATRIFNMDNLWTQKMFDHARFQFPESPRLTFSNDPGKLRDHRDNGGIDVVLLPQSSQVGAGLRLQGRIGGVDGQVATTLWGEHNAVNLAAAAACALALGLEPRTIWKNMALCQAHWGRMQSLQGKNEIQILFDGYNANPESMQALLRSVSSVPKRKFAVLAEMKELGESAPAAHRRLGENAAREGFEAIYFYGPSAQDFAAGAMSAGYDKNLIISDTYEESLALQVASMLNPEDLVIVKGSRGMKTEQFVRLLQPTHFETK